MSLCVLRSIFSAHICCFPCTWDVLALRLLHSVGSRYVCKRIMSASPHLRQQKINYIGRSKCQSNQVANVSQIFHNQHMVCRTIHTVHLQQRGPSILLGLPFVLSLNSIIPCYDWCCQFFTTHSSSLTTHSSVLTTAAYGYLGYQYLA